VAVPLPLHARAFLKSLSQMAGADAVVAVLKPLLSRVAAVSRLRRAALVAGCIVFPVLMCGGSFFALRLVQGITREYPDMMDLSMLLQVRTTGRLFGGKKAHLPTDRQIAIYIAHHYRGFITNETAWSSWMVMSSIKGASRKFAEQSVAEHPAPTEAEIKEAEAAVGKHVPVVVMAVTLLVYVGLPAVVAALLFRSGLVLLIAGVTYVRKDGLRASRLRLLWRAMVTWSPVAPVFGVATAALQTHWVWAPWLALALLGLLAAVSLALPTRGLQDRLAGTWPIPR
jgi:hypothetical protein